MKSRINSKINNTKGKNNYSLRVRLQGFNSESRDKALGYCCHHQIYVGISMLNKKKCNNCKRYIVLNKEVLL